MGDICVTLLCPLSDTSWTWDVKQSIEFHLVNTPLICTGMLLSDSWLDCTGISSSIRHIWRGGEGSSMNIQYSIYKILYSQFNSVKECVKGSIDLVNILLKIIELFFKQKQMMFRGFSLKDCPNIQL